MPLHFDHLLELGAFPQLVGFKFVVVHHLLRGGYHHFLLMDLSVQNYLFCRHLNRRRVHVFHSRRLHCKVVSINISLCTSFSFLSFSVKLCTLFPSYSSLHKSLSFSLYQYFSLSFSHITLRLYHLCLSSSSLSFPQLGMSSGTKLPYSTKATSEVKIETKSLRSLRKGPCSLCLIDRTTT